MAAQVTPDGHVIPPLNITAPAPVINLRGFRWTTVDDKFGGSPSEHHEDGQNGNGQQVLAAFPPGGLPPFHGHPGPSGPPHHDPAPPAPTPAVGSLPDILATQLDLTSGHITAPAPDFPLTAFQGSYAGNGFNMIFRPLAAKDKTPLGPLGPDDFGDNILQLSLTLEQLTFGATIGEIPNRGLTLNSQETINLGGLPYLQTIQDVTNPATGLGDSLDKRGIHFETGMWLTVPATTAPANPASITRMGTIPHGTTILAQALSPQRGSGRLGGQPGKPTIDKADTTPFSIGNFSAKVVFPSMDAKRKDTARLPQDLSKFNEEKGGSGTITTDIIKNPNLVLEKALNGLNVSDTITFEVVTGNTADTATGAMNGGGTSNISFLLGNQQAAAAGTTPSPPPAPNAHAFAMKSKFWIETVQYQVTVPQFTTRDPVLLKPTMPKDSTAPTPVFLVTPPAKLPSKSQTITVPGVQIQYSQNVSLNFAPLTWPHISVATLVPTGPQPFAMA